MGDTALDHNLNDKIPVWTKLKKGDTWVFLYKEPQLFTIGETISRRFDKTHKGSFRVTRVYDTNSIAAQFIEYLT